MIYSIQNDRAAPSPQPTTKDPSLRVLRADISPVNDSLVDDLRQVYARDLIIETVDSADHDKAEKEVYVVNPSANADSHVVADIPLKHQ